MICLRHLSVLALLRVWLMPEALAAEGRAVEAFSCHNFVADLKGTATPKPGCLELNIQSRLCQMRLKPIGVSPATPGEKRTSKEARQRWI
jgi:hypothetical protein